MSCRLPGAVTAVDLRPVVICTITHSNSVPINVINLSALLPLVVRGAGVLTACSANQRSSPSQNQSRHAAIPRQ
jgi:hypothetical protein